MERKIYGDPSSINVLIQPVDDYEGLESEAAYIRREYGEDFCLVAFKVDDWDDDLSPWEAPAVFGNRAFGGNAHKTLDLILKETAAGGRKHYIGGYSLAALFALWAVTQSDAFKGAACASPSVWFPGFTAHLKENGVRTGLVYLSLGDREEKTRNQTMATVGERIRFIAAWLRSKDITCILEWNEGNHFKDADIRTAKAFVWLLKQDRNS